MGMSALRRYRREQITKLEDVTPKQEEKKEVKSVKKKAVKKEK